MPQHPLLEALLEALYPTRCAGCDLPGRLVCAECRDTLPLIDQRRACPRCGAPEGARWCGECPEDPFAFAAMRCAGVFEPPLSRMVALHKDADEQRLAGTFAGMLACAVGEWRGWADAVVAVPARRSAVARRGYDHGSAIAACLAVRLGVPAIDALTARPVRDQRLLTRDRRRANVRGSLAAVPGVSLPARLLLVDDVMTTGATLDAAAAALLSAGATEVRALAVARAG